jgi:PKD repeat protein
MSNLLIASDMDTFYDAMSQAKPGDTIQLLGGNYGAVVLKNIPDSRHTFASNLNIVSADLENPAIFTGLQVSGAQDLTFDGIVFDYQFASGDEGWNSPFAFYGATGLTIRNSIFDGDLAQNVSAEEDGFGFGVGAVVRGSSDVVFENNEMFDFWKGIKVLESTNVVISGNDIHSMRMDGINFAEVDNILIEDNYIHDFNRTTLSWDHSDFIQTWTANSERPSTDIVIRKNTLDIGDGDATQSIFLGNTLVDRGEAGEEMYFRNVTIEDNLIINGQTHGIGVGAAFGVIVRGNTVVHSDGNNPDGADLAVEIPRISVSSLSHNVLVTGNITAEVLIDEEHHESRSDWTVTGNVLVQDQDRTAPNHYSNVFVSSTIDNNGFRPLDDGPAGGMGVPVGDELQLQFHASIDPNNTSARSFDATTSVLHHADLPEGTSYVWNFGDGTTAAGIKVNHVFGDSGSYPVILTVTVPGGPHAQIVQQVTLHDPMLASYSVGHAVTLTSMASSDIQLTEAIHDNGIVLGAADGPALSISRLALTDLITAHDFAIDISVALDEGTTGTVFRFGRDIVANVDKNGHLIVSVKSSTSDASVILRSSDMNMADGQPHHITLRLDDGQLQIWTDGQLADSNSMEGSLAGSGNHNFWLGTPWGASATGVIDAFSITAGEKAFMPATTSAQPEAVIVAELSPVDVAELSPVDVEQNTQVDDSVDWISVLNFDPVSGFVANGQNVLSEHSQSGSFSNLGLQLGATGISAHVSRGIVENLVTSDGFRIAFTVRSDTDDSAGQLFGIGGSISTLIDTNGNLTVRIMTQDNGTLRFTTRDIDVSDGTSRDVVMTYDRQLDHLSVTIDGENAIDVSLPSDIGLGNSQGLVFGNSWGQQNFAGILDHFSAWDHLPNSQEDMNDPDSLQFHAVVIDDAYII